MDDNERFNQLESLMADMLRRMDQLAASQERTNARVEHLVTNVEQLASGLQCTNNILVDRIS